MEAGAAVPHGTGAFFQRVNPGPFSVNIISPTEQLILNGNDGAETITGTTGLNGVITMTVNGGNGNHYGCGGSCCLRGTQVLTRDGYRSIESLAVGEVVATRFGEQVEQLLADVIQEIRTFGIRAGKTSDGRNIYTVVEVRISGQVPTACTGKKYEPFPELVRARLERRKNREKRS